MNALFEQLGIDWRLLLSQAVNFLLLLIVLRIFVYKPVLKILNERQKKIREGMEKTEEADRRLKETNAMALQKIKEAETKAVAILGRTEEKAKELEAKLMQQAQEKETEFLKNAELAAKAKEAEAERIIRHEAVGIVRQAIAKTVELSPEKIDDALIRKAIQEIQR